MPGASHALQQHAYGPGRADLADQVYNSDVDAQFQGRGGHADLDLPALQFLFGGQAGGAGKAAVMGHDRIVAQPGRKLVGDALNQPACVDEDQGCAVTADQIGHGLQCLVPQLVGGDGAQFPLGQLDRKVDGPGAAGVYYQAVRFTIRRDGLAAHQQPPNLVYGALGCRQADADDRVLSQGTEPLNGQR